MRAQKLPPPNPDQFPVHNGGHDVTWRQSQSLLYQHDLRIDPPDDEGSYWCVYPISKTLKGRPLEMTSNLQNLYRWLIGYDTGYRVAIQSYGHVVREKPEVEFEPAVE